MSNNITNQLVFIPSKGFVELEIQSSQTISASRIDKWVKRIAFLEKDSDFKKITIRADQKNYTLGSDFQSKRIQKLDSKATSSLVVRTIQTQSRVLQTRLKTFDEIVQEFLQDLPCTDVPLVCFFWNCLIYPLAGLIYAFISPTTKDFHTFEREVFGKHEDSLLTALKWSHETLECAEDPLTQIGEKFTVKEQLQEAYQLGQQWQTRNSLQERKDFVGSLLETLAQRIETVKNKGAKGAINLLLLPTGYWKKGFFQPILWAFYLDRKGKLCLSEMSPGKQMVAHDFSWILPGKGDASKGKEKEKAGQPEVQEMVEDRFAPTLLALLSLSVKPSQESLEATKKDPLSLVPEFLEMLPVETLEKSFPGFGKMLGVGQSLALNGNISLDLNQLKEISSDQISLEEFRQRLLLSSGAEPFERKERRPEVKEDPWAVLQETLSLQFPQSSLADKAFFTLTVLNDRLTKVIDSLDEMPLEQKKNWIHKLQKDKELFEKQWNKMAGDDESFQKVFGSGCLFESFRKNLEALSIEVKKLNLINGSYAIEHASALSAVEPKPFSFNLPETQNSASKSDSIQKDSTLSAILFTEEDYAQLSSLKEAFNGGDIDTILTSLKLLEERIDTLVDTKEHAYVQALFRQIFLQIPANQEALFWTALSERARQNDSSDCFNQFTFYLSKILHCYWETKISVAYFQLEAEDPIAILTAFMAVSHSQRQRIEWAKSKLSVGALAALYSISTDNPSLPDDDSICSKISAEDAFLVSLDLPNYNEWQRASSDYLNCYLDSGVFLFPNLNPRMASQLFSLRTSNEGLLNTSKYLLDLPHLASTRAQKIVDYYEKQNQKAPTPLKKPSDEQKASERKELEKSLYNSRNLNSSVSLVATSGLSDNFRTFIFANSLFYPISRLESHSSMKSFWDAMTTSSSWFDRYPKYAESLQDYPRLDIRVNPDNLHETLIHEKGNPEAIIVTVAGFGSLKNESLQKKPSIVEKDTEQAICSGLDLYKNPHHEAIGDHSQNSSLLEDYVGDYQMIKKVTTFNFILKLQGLHSGFKEITEASLLSHQLSLEDNSNSILTWQQRSAKVTKTFLLRRYKTHRWNNDSSSIIFILDLALQRFDLLDLPDSQRRLFSICFTPDIMLDLLKKNPDYFVERIPLWQTAIETSLAAGNYQRVLFFLMITTHIVYHAQFLEPNKQRKTIINQMPTLFTEFQVSGKPFKFSDLEASSKLPLDFAGQVDLAAYWLAVLAHHPDSMEPGVLLKEDPSKTLSQLFLAVQRLNTYGDQATIPQIGRMGTLWFQETFLPWSLENLPEETISQAIDSWVTATNSRPLGWEDWAPTPDARHIWVKGNSRVDLAAMQILKVNGTLPKGIQVNLPKAVFQSREYQRLFDSKTFTYKMTPGHASGEQIYTFKDDKGNPIRIRYQTATEELTIERQFKKTDRHTWLRFVLPKDPSKSKGFEKELQEQGLWINKKGKKGIALFGNLPLQLRFDAKGTLSSATYNGREIVVDPTLTRTLGCLAEQKILFLRKPDSSAVTEIILLGQEIHLLRKSEKAPWIVQEGPYRGYQWKIGALGKRAEKFADFGVNQEQLGLSLYDTEHREIHFLFWPHLIETPHAHKKHPLERLEIAKPIEAAPPLHLTIDANGTEKGSSATYLYLAYLHGVKHDYESAFYYLEKASKEQISGDPSSLQQILQRFHHLKGHSLRMSALKLKAILMVEKIQRQQTEKPLYDKSYLDRATLLCKLYEDYRKAWDRNQKHHDYLQESERIFLLSQEEIEELSRVSHESLQFLVSRRQSFEKTISLSAPHPSEAAWTSMMPALLHYRKAPDNLLDLFITEPSPQLIATYFFDLWNLIIDQKLTSQDLILLFQPMPISMEQENLRKALLILAKRPIKKRTEELKWDLAKIQELQDLLPESIPGALWTGIELLADPEKQKALTQSCEELYKKLEEVLKSHSGPILLDKKTKNRGKLPSKYVDPTALKKHLRKNPQRFGPELSPRLQKALDDPAFCLKLQQLKEENLIPETIALIEMECHLNALTAVREKELSARILQLEEKLRTREKEPQVSKVASLPPESPLLNLSLCLSSVDVNTAVMLSESKLQQAKDKLLERFPTEVEDDPLEAEENRHYQEALEQAHKDLVTKVQSHDKTIDPQQLTIYATTTETHAQTVAEEAQILKEEILRELRTCDRKGFPKSLRQTIANESKIGTEELFHQLLNHYQKLQLQNPDLEKKLDHYLLAAIEANILQSEVSDLLSDLSAMPEKERAVTNFEWNTLSFKTIALVQAATNRTRYIDNKELQDPKIYRKLLVSELRNNIIHRPEQIKLILEMSAFPANWYELRMGLGKTSVIFPTVLLLLAEGGMLPVGFVKDQILEQHATEIDRTTRLMLSQASIRYTFKLNDPKNAALLAEDYLRLLKAKEEKGYIITTVHSKNSLDHKLAVLQAKKKEVAILYSQNETDELITSLTEIHKQIYWIGKIKTLLEGDPEFYGFTTQSIGDEVDDIWNVIYEDNLGVGKLLPLETTLIHLSRIFIETILERWETNNKSSSSSSSQEDSEEDPLVRLGDLILTGESAAIRPEELKETILPALVDALFENKGFLDLLGSPEILDKINQQELRDYLCFQGKRPEGLPSKEECTIGQKYPQKENFRSSSLHPHRNKAEEQEEKSRLNRLNHFRCTISALKHILQSTAASSFGQNPGINIDIKKSNGYMVGPQIGGEEQTSMLYSVQYDILFNHNLIYAAKLLDTPFLERTLIELQETNPKKYLDLLQRAQGKDLIAFLNEKENWRDRLDLLQTQIIQGLHVRRREEQYIMNVQESVSQNVGGMTGTLNPHLLPKTRDIQKTLSTVEPETHLRIACMADPEISFAPDSNEGMLNTLKGFAKDTQCKAIFNSSAPLSGRSTTQVIEQLRSVKNRTWIFYSEDRTLQIWHPGKNKPQPIGKKALKKLLRQDSFLKNNCCFYYGPLDCRGVDLPIPAGYAAAITGPTTAAAEFYQTLWRARGLGDIHSLKFISTQAVQERLPQQADWIDLTSDIRKQTREPAKKLHLKAYSVPLSIPLKKAVRNLLNAPRKEQENPDYWSNPENLLAQTACDIIIEEATHDILYKKRQVDFDQDDTKTSFLQSKEHFERIYQAELSLLEETKRKTLTALGNVSTPVAKRCLEQAKEKFAMARALLEPQKEAFFNNWDQHKNLFEDQIPTNGTGEASSLEQVQESQQQQESQQVQSEEQQQESIVAHAPRAFEEHPFIHWEFGSLILAVERNMTNNLNLFTAIEAPHKIYVSKKAIASAANMSLKQLLSAPKELFFPSLGQNKIYLSPNMNGCISQLEQRNGHPLGMLLVIKDTVFLVSREEYARIIAPNLQWATYKRPLAVYSFVDGQKFDQSIVLTQKGAKEVNLHDPKLLEKIIQVKWFLGTSRYSPAELEILKSIWDQGNSFSFLGNREYTREWTLKHGTKEQLELIDSLS